jgi:catechol 2,3-dioxygenase-like lactoylglutathione lyase family enzyme
MIDHVYIAVTDLAAAASFYGRTLAPLGWRELGAFSAGVEGVPELHGFGDQDYGGTTRIGSSIWLRTRAPGETGLYLGLVADSTDAVDAGYRAAVAAGGTGATPPGLREHFGPGYYAANVIDADGNQLEIVHKSWNPARTP